jgi:hypothetical protein
MRMRRLAMGAPKAKSSPSRRLRLRSVPSGIPLIQATNIVIEPKKMGIQLINTCKKPHLREHCWCLKLCTPYILHMQPKYSLPWLKYEPEGLRHHTNTTHKTRLRNNRRNDGLTNTNEGTNHFKLKLQLI